MEASIRGKIENMIDGLTSEKGLAAASSIFVEFKPIMKSEQDAIFGYILGLAMAIFTANYLEKYNREPNTSECEKFLKMFDERSIIIMSKIKKFSKL